MPGATLFCISFTKSIFCTAPHRHNRYHFTTDLMPHRVRCHGNMKQAINAHVVTTSLVHPSFLHLLLRCDSAKHGYLELLLCPPCSSKSPQTCFETMSRRLTQHQWRTSWNAICPSQCTSSVSWGRTHTKVCKAPHLNLLCSHHAPGWLCSKSHQDSVSPRF